MRRVAVLLLASLPACTSGGTDRVDLPSPSASAPPSVTSAPTLATTESSTGSAAPSRSAGPAFLVTDVSFVSTTRGWAIGPDGLRATSDGGVSWTTAPVPPDDATSVRFANDTVGFAWADGGDLWVTRDAAATWRRAGMAQVRALEVAAGTVWALAGEVPYPWVVRGPLGGPFTKLGHTPNRGASLDVHGGTAYLLGASGAGPVGASMDVWHRSGSKATNRKLPCAPDEEETYVPSAGLGVSTDASIVMVCELGQPYRGVSAYRSSDEGATWRSIPAPPEAAYDVAVVRGRVFSWNRDLYVLVNGEWTRSLVGPVSLKGFRLVGFQDDTHGLAADHEGSLSMTTDAGRTWRRVQL